MRIIDIKLFAKQYFCQLILNEMRIIYINFFFKTSIISKICLARVCFFFCQFKIFENNLSFISNVNVIGYIIIQTQNKWEDLYSDFYRNYHQSHKAVILIALMNISNVITWRKATLHSEKSRSMPENSGKLRTQDMKLCCLVSYIKGPESSK